MAYGDGSTAIRQRALRDYFEPALRAHSTRISIPVKPLMQDLEAEGFPINQPRNFCKSLQAQSFLREIGAKGIKLDHVEGPPSGTGTSVVLHYTVEYSANEPPPPAQETDRERIRRLLDSIFGLYAEEIAAEGGAEAVIKRLRSED